MQPIVSSFAAWWRPLPTLCAVCHDWATSRVCDACRLRFAPLVPRCERCALRVPDGIRQCADCARTGSPLDRGVAATDYAFPWDRLVAGFKFQRQLDLTRALAQMMAEAVRRAAPPDPDLLVPVPLGAARLGERGYNQSWLLARALSCSTGVPARRDLLCRLVDTPHQAGLPLQERRGNVQGSFGVVPQAASALRGRRVALIDDVLTTGATAGEAARVLRAAGAASVQVWVVARTPAPSDA